MNNQTQYKLLGDSPYFEDKDALDFHSLAKGLVDLLRDTGDSTPLTIGIQAPWGMGKSSFMHQLQRLLNEDSELFKTVMFNAWTFDGEDILEGLMKTVLNQLDPGILKRTLRNKKFTKAFHAIARIAASWFGIGKMVDEIWEAINIDPRARNELRELIVDTMSEWVKKTPKRDYERTIIVFIDDLDRCSPESVFRVFEAIKLYLDSKGFVFVLGMDSEIVSEAVLEQKKYSKRITSEQYVEKIVQISYYIPAATPEQIHRLFDSYTEASGTEELFSKDSAKLIIQRCNSNPRRIKRFINVFILEHLLNPESKKLQPQLLIKIIMLGMYYRAFCRLFDPEAEVSLITEFLEYQGAKRDLEGIPSPGEDQAKEHGTVFTRYGLPSPGSYETGDKAVTALNSRVPEDFITLATNESFIKLVESIEEQDRNVVSAHIKRVGEAVIRETDEKRRSPVDAAESIALGGLRMLWVDDNPDRNAATAESLRATGAHVLQVASTDEAVAALKREPGRYNILVSDVKRGERRMAGFEDLDLIRKEGEYDGPVVFYTLIVRQQDREEAEKLSALITNNPTEFQQFLSMTALDIAEELLSKSAFQGKLHSMRKIEQDAANMLDRMSPEDVVKKLRLDGISLAMAEAAVKYAQAKKFEESVEMKK